MKLGLLVYGDIICLLFFSAIGRFSHGCPCSTPRRSRRTPSLLVRENQKYFAADVHLVVEWTGLVTDLGIVQGITTERLPLVDLAMMQKGAMAWGVMLSMRLKHGLFGYR